MPHTHVGPNGAKFTPTASKVTIAAMEKRGEWKPIKAKAQSKPAPASKSDNK